MLDLPRSHATPYARLGWSIERLEKELRALRIQDDHGAQLFKEAFAYLNAATKIDELKSSLAGRTPGGVTGRGMQHGNSERDRSNLNNGDVLETRGASGTHSHCDNSGKSPLPSSHRIFMGEEAVERIEEELCGEVNVCEVNVCEEGAVVQLGEDVQLNGSDAAHDPQEGFGEVQCRGTVEPVDRPSEDDAQRSRNRSGSSNAPQMQTSTLRNYSRMMPQSETILVEDGNAEMCSPM